MILNNVVKLSPVILTAICFCFGPFNPDDPAPPDGQSGGNGGTTRTRATVAYWDFNEGEGVIIGDQSDYKNNGSASQCSWDSSAGLDGSALDFNGTNSYVAVQHDSSLDFGTGDFTVSAWIKPDTSLKNKNNGQYDILSKGKEGNGFTISLFRNRVCGYVGSWTAITDADTTFPIFDTLWHNVILERSNNTVTMYLDTKKVHSYDCSESITTTSNLYLGKNPSREDFYNGLLDEVKIINYAWSSQDRSKEFNRF